MSFYPNVYTCECVQEVLHNMYTPPETAGLVLTKFYSMFYSVQSWSSALKGHQVFSSAEVLGNLGRGIL